MSEKRFRLFPKDMRFMPYVWLSYWAMYVGFVLFSQTSITRTLTGLSLLLLFLIPFRQLFWWKEERMHVVIISMIVISVLLIVFCNPTFLYMAYYIVYPIGQLPTRRQLFGWAVATMTILVFAVPFSLYPIRGFFGYGTVIPLYMTGIMMPFGMRAFRQWKQTSEELKLKNRQIEHLTQQAERQRIARDLHDILGHTLSMITLKSELAEKLVHRDPERAVKEIHDVQIASRAALQQVREVVTNMHTVSLAEEIDNAVRLLKAAGINYLLRGQENAVQVGSLAGTILAMSVREAVTNVVRHSRASFCVIEIKQTQAVTEICVIDNGIGLPAPVEAEAKKGGHGLYGIRERLELVGGTLHLLPGEPSGTVVAIRIPRIVSGREEEERIV